MKSSSKYQNVFIASTLSETFKKHQDDINPRLLLLTNYGFISGYVYEPAADTLDIDEYVKNIVDNSRYPDLNIIGVIKTKAVTENDIELIGDGSFVVLKDVKVYKDNLSQPVMNTNVMLVHCEDIIGINYATPESGI